MANDLSFNQVATVLAELCTQATGISALRATDLSSFMTVATTVLKTGPEQIYNAIGVVLGRTIFSNRPYYAKLRGLQVTDGMFKLHTRKLQLSDGKFEPENEAAAWPVFYDSTHSTNPIGEGEAVDMQKIKKGVPVQTNFYGMNTFSDRYTIFDYMLDVAFSNPSELGLFWAMLVQNVSDRFEQAREVLARAILCNAIAACVTLNESGRVIHLLTEYNARTGLSLDAQTVYDPDNYPGFVRWAFGRIGTLSSYMTERSGLYQTQLTGKPLMRHTPIEKQRLYIYAPEELQMRANVLSTTFHDKFLQMADHEMVNFWQSIDTPGTVKVTPSYISAAGAATSAGQTVTVENVFGVLMDEEAAGFATVKSTFKPAPYNAAGDYQNFFLKEYNKIYFDNTEKVIVLLLD